MSAGWLALFIAALLSLITLVIFILRIMRNPEATRSSEIIKLAATHVLIILLATAFALADTFWDGQPTRGRIPSF